jgi:hypothetical protein
LANPTGESNGEVLRLDFDRRLMLQSHGSVLTCDAGLLAYRELDDALGLTAMVGEIVADARTGMNARHALVGTPRRARWAVSRIQSRVQRSVVMRSRQTRGRRAS